MISSEEYIKLPPSIQRKYFSSEERYQIAQQSAAEKRQRQPVKKESSPQLKPKASCDFSKRRKTIRKSESKKQRRSSLPLVFDAASTDNGGAAFYDSLPDKVKRSQFDNEERINILRSLESERPHTSSGKVSFDNISWDKNRSASVETPRIQHSTCTTPSLHSPAPSVATSSRSYDSRLSNQRSAHSLRKESTQPPTPSFTTTKVRTPEQERLASRRHFLLHPIPLPPPVLAPVAGLVSPDTEKYMQREQAFVLHIEGEDYNMDMETTPTQELELTQMKLKNMPPAWYDEKLDFGFQRDSRKPSTSTYDSWEHPRTMSPSLSDAASSHGPMTPISPAMFGLQYDTQPVQPSLQQIIESQLNITNFSHIHQGPPPDYDMVKSRRSKPKHLVDGFYEEQDPNQPYSITIHYDNHDPLALETLPVSDDMSGAHGAFAVRPEHASGFRKVLKVIRGH